MTDANNEEMVAQLFDALPQGWFSGKTGSSIWLTGYLAFKVDDAQLSGGMRRINLGNVIATLRGGGFSYWDGGRIKLSSQNGTPTASIEGLGAVEAPHGHYLALCTPHDRDGSEGNEPTTRARISRAAALLAAVFGKNVAFHKLFENRLSLENLQIQVSSPAVESPGWFPAVSATDQAVSAAEQISSKIASLQESDRRRAELSLHWFEQATFNSGIDAFLKYWIAIESLSMPDTTNVRPLEELFSKAYAMDMETTKRTFRIGRICNVRSDIVHKGEFAPTHGNLSRYMEALYVDALYATLNVPFERRALAILNRADFDWSLLVTGKLKE